MIIQMQKLLEILVALLYPRRCPICHQIVAEKGQKICEKCRKYAPPITEPRCKKCSKRLEAAEKEYCYDCENNHHVYTRGLSLFAYESKLKQSLYQIKFHNKREYLDFYAEEVVRVLGETILAWEAEALIPIPLHRRKYQKRGFNQADILAKKLGVLLGIPVLSDYVIRQKKTEPQKELSLKERKKNLKKAFKIKADDVKLKRIILIDDIYTTGSTLDAVAAILREQGVQTIYFITLCIGKGDC